MNRVYLIALLALVSSCNEGRIAELESSLGSKTREIQKLEDEIQALHEELRDAASEFEDLELKYKAALINSKQCEINYERYRYGNGHCLTRYVRNQGQVTICGAEKIIDFLNDHYCL
jgi:predicted RNase H-like nuclease (RuvC/YqgF family)